jgi:hypothetical protein
MATDRTAPTSGHWYERWLKPPLEDYAARLSGITHERARFASEVVPWLVDGVRA